MSYFSFALPTLIAHQSITQYTFASIWSSFGVGVKAQISDAPEIIQGANCINFKVKHNFLL
jgi:hypothetical protein